MLLENIFATAFVIFLIMLVAVTIMGRYNLFAHRRYDNAMLITLMGSFFVTIITAAMWLGSAI